MCMYVSVCDKEPNTSLTVVTQLPICQSATCGEAVQSVVCASDKELSTAHKVVIQELSGRARWCRFGVTGV